jgi:hypothetical protein
LPREVKCTSQEQSVIYRRGSKMNRVAIWHLGAGVRQACGN